MNTASLIQYSLSRTVVKKIVICLGCHANKWARRSVDNSSSCSEADTRYSIDPARMVAHLLLQQCRPPANDVHNPEKNRLHARDIHGRPRAYYSYKAAQNTLFSGGGGKHKSSPHTRGYIRRPQMWDSEPVPDFMGVWCSRLLLGHHAQPTRCALLLPHVPQELLPEAVERVARAHRLVRQEDVLVVMEDRTVPLGLVRLTHSSASLNSIEVHATSLAHRSSSAKIIDETSRSHHYLGNTHDTSATDKTVRRDLLMTQTPRVDERVAQALDLFAPSERTFSTLHIGITPMHENEDGQKMFINSSSAFIVTGVGVHGCNRFRAPPNHRIPLTVEEKERVGHVLVPLATFATALWTVDPERCADYLRKITPTPSYLVPANTNKRLWSTMQASMLSTRDTALLDAYYSGNPLHPRLSADQTTYLAETLLRRLEEKGGSFAYAPSRMRTRE